MKLNCDLGESFGAWSMGLDDQAMPHIDQANIACGFHAGDPVVLANTLALAKEHRVTVGAHPSYPDRQGFGRRSMTLSENELYQTVQYQMAAVEGMARVQGLTLEYVKPHGALYNDMMKDEAIRNTLMKAVRDYPTPLTLMIQATPRFEEHQHEANALKLPLWFEAFADRQYDDEGFLVSRQLPGAVLSEREMIEQVKTLLTDQVIYSRSKKALSFPVDSLCVHGDNPVGIQHIQTIKTLITDHDL